MTYRVMREGEGFFLSKNFVRQFSSCYAPCRNIPTSKVTAKTLVDYVKGDASVFFLSKVWNFQKESLPLQSKKNLNLFILITIIKNL